MVRVLPNALLAWFACEIMFCNFVTVLIGIDFVSKLGPIKSKKESLKPFWLKDFVLK